MNLLLDSHVFLWLLNDPQLIGPETTQLLRSNNGSVYVSSISIWELGLKYKKGKLPYSISELLEGVEALQATLLGLESSHLTMFETIELPHKDPFDTLLVAQSESESQLLITDDTDILASSYSTHNSSK